jgi:hypothetical protein
LGPDDHGCDDAGGRDGREEQAGGSGLSGAGTESDQEQAAAHGASVVVAPAMVRPTVMAAALAMSMRAGGWCPAAAEPIAMSAPTAR